MHSVVNTKNNVSKSGCSSGVEHNLAKVGVEGSNPFARSSSKAGVVGEVYVDGHF